MIPWVNVIEVVHYLPTHYGKSGVKILLSRSKQEGTGEIKWALDTALGSLEKDRCCLKVEAVTVFRKGKRFF